ncbi:hypothetical protein [Bradyrhizobium sp. CCBAU 051011]|uniref:hypothetical protein n=1 Tax=Bradyrhizobium sp. CCBAU 051011 TaxID=858422 RepID=UPI00192A2688|nr:hypothetical protein [Bradyrhizobium sp. CCBAU 051011]
MTKAAKKPAASKIKKAATSKAALVEKLSPTTPPDTKPTESVAKCPVPPDMDETVPLLKHLGGSIHDDWNQALCNQVLNAAKYPKNATPEDKAKLYFSHLAFLTGVNPQDVIEGMMAAQLFASHSASMECYRRAMLPDQSLEGRTANLVQAAKLTRANASVVEALTKYRNKGKQRIVIEHVHVYQGGQAAFIATGAPGEGVAKIKEVQPHAIGHAPSAPLRCQDPSRLALPVARNGKRTLPDARRAIAGSA